MVLSLSQYHDAAQPERCVHNVGKLGDGRRGRRRLLVGSGHCTTKRSMVGLEEVRLIRIKSLDALL